jgi:hypothetical protein
MKDLIIDILVYLSNKNTLLSKIDTIGVNIFFFNEILYLKLFLVSRIKFLMEFNL